MATPKDKGARPSHIPVMLGEVIKQLDPKDGEVALDCTVGSGGHSLAIAKKLGPTGLLVALDRDEDAIERSRETLNDAPCRIEFAHTNYSELETALDKFNVKETNVTLLDLGVSSPQLDTKERGFSFNKDGPLDMRMNKQDAITAEAIVNESSKSELEIIFKDYGEEKNASQIAEKIVSTRSRERIKTTLQLASLIEDARNNRRGRIHPATKVFQALRIAVNSELSSVKTGVRAAWNRLAPGGRLGVISFHSLEDKIIKGFFKEHARDADGRIQRRSSHTPKWAEQQENPRARSAKLRVIRKSEITDGGKK